MAERIIVWEIKIGCSWVSVSESTFISTMRIACDVVKLRGNETKFAVFYNKSGYPVGKLTVKEV